MYFILVTSIPVQVTDAESRKQQLNAWKKTKINSSSNKENMENNSNALAKQMEKMQQDLIHMQNKVKEGEEKYTNIQSTMQQFLGYFSLSMPFSFHPPCLVH